MDLISILIFSHKCYLIMICRYIEVYKSSLAELHKKVGKPSPWTGGRPGPYDRPGVFNNNFDFGTADFFGSIAGWLSFYGRR